MLLSSHVSGTELQTGDTDTVPVPSNVESGQQSSNKLQIMIRAMKKKNRYAIETNAGRKISGFRWGSLRS